MKGLILKDLWVMKRYARTSLLVVAIFAVVSLLSADNSSFAGMISMMLSMLSINAFSYDDQAKWDRYAVALPLSRKTIVLARYLLGGVLWLVGVLLSTALIFLSSAIHQSPIAPESMTIVVVIASGMLLSTAGMLPLIYRYGVEKARILMILSLLAAGALVAVPFLLFGEDALGFIFFGLPILSALAYAASFFLSAAIMRTKAY